MHFASKCGDLVLLGDLIDLRRSILDQEGTVATVGRVEGGVLSIDELFQLAGCLGVAGD